MQIIKQLYQISLRKREPQDLDYSLEAAIIFTMSVIFLRYISFITLEPLSNPVAYSLVSILGEVAALYLVFRISGKANRFIQTLTALFGITIIATVVMAIMSLTIILQLALPVLLIWTVYLMVVILRTALECSTFNALILTIVSNVAGYFIVILIFPDFQTEMQEILDAMVVAIEAAQLEANSK